MAAKIIIEDKQGRRIYRNFLDAELYKNAFKAIQEEFCYYLFEDFAPMLIERHGVIAMNACTDHNFREANFIPTSTIRRGKNSRECKIFIKGGLTDFYLSRMMRNIIHENPFFYNAIAAFYKNQPLSYSRNFDQLIVKPKESEESYLSLDCEFPKPLASAGSKENPFHYVNIFCLAAPPTEEGEENNFDQGGVCILENFDKYYEFFRQEFSPKGSFPLEKQPLHNKGKTVLKTLKIDLLNCKLKEIYGPNVPLLNWVHLNLQPGDFVLLDCRIPYKFNKNIKNIPAVFTTVSLEPKLSNSTFSKESRLIQQAVNEGKVGDWNSTTYKNTNYDEYSWRLNRKDNYSLSSTLPAKPYNNYQELVYGFKNANL